MGCREKTLAACLKTAIDGSRSGTWWEMLGRIRKRINRGFQISKSSGGAVTEGCQSFEGRKGLRFQAVLLVL